jgi:hypothetical protein
MEDLWSRWRAQRFALALAVGAGALACLGTAAGLGYAHGGSPSGGQYPGQVQYCVFGSGEYAPQSEYPPQSCSSQQAQYCGFDREYTPQIACLPGKQSAPPSPPRGAHGIYGGSERSPGASGSGRLKMLTR